MRFQAFSESLAADAGRRAEHEAAELDELERGRPRPERYLVAWLPWLSLLGRWRNDTEHEAEKSLLVAKAKGVPASEGNSAQVVEKHVTMDVEDQTTKHHLN